MKKFALALAALTISASAFAADWRQLSETQDGSKLLVDLQSLSFQPSNGINFTGALFQFVPGDGVFAYVIESDACAKGEGRLSYLLRENNEWVTKQTYWYNVKGSRMYDIAAMVLCKATEVFRQGQAQAERERQQNKKSTKNSV